jgi:KaiC/GvpD/RAD55 family RecA-like ATPase
LDASAVPRIPLIEDLTREPIPPGSIILVEFDATSQWYNASFTIASGWVKTGGLASYNVLNHPPESARLQLKNLGLDVEALEKDGKLRIIDWYTIQLGQKSSEKYAHDSLKIADLSLFYSRRMIPTDTSPWPGTGYHLGPGVIRISDDESVLIRFNDEKSFIDYYRTREVPTASVRKSTAFDGFVKGVFSDYLYKSLETSVDGVIDFKLEEEGKSTRDLMRIRSMRNVHFDRKWHEVTLGDNFEVTLKK